MTFRFMSLLAAATALAVLPAATFAASRTTTTRPASSDAWLNSRNVFKDFRDTASAAADSATTLQSFTRFNEENWRTHTVELDRLKTGINEMSSMMKRLEEIRPSAAPWERQAIDEAHKLLASMAADTETAIKTLNNNTDRLYLSAYRTPITNLASESQRLLSSLEHACKLGHVQEKEKHLENVVSTEAGSL